LQSKIRSSTRIEHIDYAEDLAQIYAGAMLAICPVFKGFGLINKAIEAMACGLPVVGGSAAFNGIPGFEPNVHGAVCATRSTKDFAATIATLINDEQRRRKIGTAAKRLISGQFNWETTIQIVNRAITESEPD
jgi:glycosyltransferase involved in cell wall biosynthesis